MSDVEFTSKHWVMATTLDEGWEDGDSTTWSADFHSEDGAREFYRLLTKSVDERLLVVRLVGPDGVSYLAEWRAPECARCGALNRRAFPTPAGVLLCQECRAGDPDFEPAARVEEVPYWSDQIYVSAIPDGLARCKYCGEPRGEHKGITLHCRHEAFVLYQALGGYARQRWSEFVFEAPMTEAGDHFEKPGVPECICCGRPRSHHAASTNRCERVYVERYLGLRLGAVGDDRVESSVGEKEARPRHKPAPFDADSISVSLSSEAPKTAVLYDNSITTELSEADGWEVSVSVADYLVESNAAGAVIGVFPIHPDLAAAVPTPECRHVGRGRFEVHDSLSGETYKFHDRVTRLFRHGDAVLGNKRVGSRYYVALMEGGLAVDLGRVERLDRVPQRWRLYTGSDANVAEYIESDSFEKVAREGADHYWFLKGAK
jgi:hypothetical protein